jgi:hypothetical protein
VIKLLKGLKKSVPEKPSAEATPALHGDCCITQFQAKFSEKDNFKAEEKKRISNPPPAPPGKPGSAGETRLRREGNGSAGGKRLRRAGAATAEPGKQDENPGSCSARRAHSCSD